MDNYIKYKKYKNLYKLLAGTREKCRNRNYNEIYKKSRDKKDNSVEKIGISPSKRYVKLGIYNRDDEEPIGNCGKGGYKTVYLALDTVKKRLIIWSKIYIKPLDEYSRKGIINEIKIMEECIKNKFIIDFFGSKYISSEQTVNIWMEYAKNGDLNDLILQYKKQGKIFSKKMIINYLYRILRGLRYLHNKNIMHCDIKPENVLLFKNIYQSKISDFGLSVIGQNGNEPEGYVPQGTLSFLAPEIIGRNDTDPPYNLKVDIYALGYLLFNLVTLSQNNVSRGEKNNIYHNFYQKINLIKETGYFEEFKKVILPIDNLTDNQEHGVSIEDINTRIKLEEKLKQAVSVINNNEINKLMEKAILLKDRDLVEKYINEIGKLNIEISDKLKNLLWTNYRVKIPRIIRESDPTNIELNILEKELELISGYIDSFNKYNLDSNNIANINGSNIEWNANYNFIDFYLNCVGYPDYRLTCEQLLDKYFKIN